MGIGRSLFLDQLDSDIAKKNRDRQVGLDRLVNKALDTEQNDSDMFSGARGLIDSPVKQRAQDPTVQGPSLAALTAKDDGKGAGQGGGGGGGELVSMLIKMFLGGG